MAIKTTIQRRTKKDVIRTEGSRVGRKDIKNNSCRKNNIIQDNYKNNKIRTDCSENIGGS